MNAKIEPSSLEGSREPSGARPISDVRRARKRRLLARFGGLVIAPSVLASVHLGVFASDQFQSTAPFTVQSANEPQQAGLATLVGAFATGGGGRDALIIRDYILSREVLERLDEEHDFIEHYQDPSRDWWARLPSDAPSEDVYEYYLDKVHVEHDSQSGNLTLTVRAFDADRAEHFAQAILDYSEQKVNELSERAREDRLATAKDEVALAEQRLEKARDAIVELQAARGDFNPEQTATEAMTVRSQLQIELAQARAELSQLAAVLQPSAAKVVAAKRRVAALQRQIQRENERLVDPDASAREGLGATMVEFEAALLDREFAQKAYESAAASLEMARIEAARQHRYLVEIAPPSRPDAPTHPKKFLGALTVFFASLALFGIASLFSAAIREHARL